MDTVDVTIPIEADLAGDVSDRQRQALGHFVSSLLRQRRRKIPAVEEGIRQLKTAAHANGLTDELIDEELETS